MGELGHSKTDCVLRLFRNLEWGMPADHAHLAPQKLYTVREDHVLPARTRAEKARRNEESGDANVAKDARAGGPQLAEPDLHCIQDVLIG